MSRVENPEIIISKGDPDPRLYVYRHRAGSNQRLEGRRARRARRSRCSSRTAAPAATASLLSIDGAGKVTLHWPEKTAGDARRGEGGRKPRCPRRTSSTTRPASNASSWCSAETPFSVATAMEAARALAAQPTARQQALALPPGFAQISLSLDKTHGPKKELP